MRWPRGSLLRLKVERCLPDLWRTLRATCRAWWKRNMARHRTVEPEEKESKALKHIREGWGMLWDHPMFAPMLNKRSYLGLAEDEDARGPNIVPPEGWAVVLSNGMLRIQVKRLAEPEEWAYIIAHCLLHLGLGHFQPPEPPE